MHWFVIYVVHSGLVIQYSFLIIDVGAWDGKHLSNTYSLFHKERKANNVTTECRPNWSGILFEADSSRFQELQRLYANNEMVICVNCLVCIEGPHSLSNQLTLYNITKFPDLLSIDIDGCDFYLWKEVRLSSFQINIGYYCKLYTIKYYNG